MFDNKIFDNSGGGGGGALTPAGSDTQIQFNDGGSFAGAAELLYAVATGVVSIGSSSAAQAALVIEGQGRASDGRSLIITNQGEAGIVALEINAHAGGTVGYGINLSAIIPINIATVGSNYAITAINHVNVADSGGASFTIGAGDQASAKHHLLLRRIGAGAHTGNSVCMLRDNSTAGNGTSPGVAADVLGTISFQGYNDNATPVLKEFAKIIGSIADASDAAEDGALDFQVMDDGTLQSMMAIVPGGVQFPNNPTVPSAILADAVQMWCADYAAGDARLSIMGEKNTNTLTLGAGNVLLRPDTMADDSVSGETFVGTAGEDLAWGDVVYMAADGKFYKADADSSSTAPAVAFCTATISADASGEFLKRGWIRDDSAYNFTKGPGASGLIYLSTDAGAVTQTAPSGTGDQVQVLGWALEADIWYFEPQLVMVEV